MRGLSRTSDVDLRRVDLWLRDERLPEVGCYSRNIRVRNELVILAVDTGD